MKKPKWWIEPLDKKKVFHGCLNCGGTGQKLSLKTRLYNRFGGWTILKNGEVCFMENPNKEFRENKTLQYIENRAKAAPYNDWRAVVNLPLRGATYQRHYDEGWTLIKPNDGFA